MFQKILNVFQNLECLEWQYDCKFGKPRCVSLYNFMDGVIDCASGFDEGTYLVLALLWIQSTVLSQFLRRRPLLLNKPIYRTSD